MSDHEEQKKAANADKLVSALEVYVRGNMMKPALTVATSLSQINYAGHFLPHANRLVKCAEEATTPDVQIAIAEGLARASSVSGTSEAKAIVLGALGEIQTATMDRSVVSRIDAIADGVRKPGSPGAPRPNARLKRN